MTTRENHHEATPKAEINPAIKQAADALIAARKQQQEAYERSFEGRPPMDNVSVLERWMQQNNITVKKLARATNYSKEYIKGVLNRRIPIRQSFALELSYVTGIILKALLNTNPHPWLETEIPDMPIPAPTLADPNQFDEDWQEAICQPKGESAAAGILEEE